MKNGDILTNENGMTCIYTDNPPKLTDIDVVEEIAGKRIEEYIHKCNLKITDHWDNYPEY
ncbi:hypothetical protein [Virgibacillus siamensis]|uniref:hypothetical protein n=1 Tax=Virgibacillus siamensis TaxID=480071 RepID=UPI000986B5AD|nr:hypothetical protein [Virgibacillus siamensis]